MGNITKEFDDRIIGVEVWASVICLLLWCVKGNLFIFEDLPAFI